MQNNAGRILASICTALWLSLAVISPALGGEYKSLEGLKSVKVMFDFRDDKPQSALVHLQLAHQTFKDKALRKIDGKPKLAVVFMGGSVKLLTSKRDGFSAEEKKTLAELDKVVAAMAKDGIRLEMCMFAADFFKVDAASVPPEIQRVPNGWISSLGYQAKGYSLIPAF